MDVASLGFRTDLMVRRLAGSTISDRGDHLVVRTPRNPTHHWGNVALFAAGPADVGRWLATFTAEFPDAGYVAIGLDGREPLDPELPALRAGGVAVEVETVLTASALREPLRRSDAVCRPLVGDDDWTQAYALRVDCDVDEGWEQPEHGSYIRLARALLTMAGRYGLDRLGARRLVIVADPGSVAIDLYRSLGFADAEGQVRLQRLPAGPGPVSAGPG